MANSSYLHISRCSTGCAWNTLGFFDFLSARTSPNACIRRLFSLPFGRRDFFGAFSYKNGHNDINWIEYLRGIVKIEILLAFQKNYTRYISLPVEADPSCIWPAASEGPEPRWDRWVSSKADGCWWVYDMKLECGARRLPLLDFLCEASSSRSFNCSLNCRICSWT